MTRKIAFLHTSPVHVATFTQLLADIAPDLAAQHMVDESLLADARARGITLELTRRIQAAIADLFDQGATAVLCTCSTIGGCAEALANVSTGPVLRVDRVMAERAVALGRRIVLVAALESTLAPTRALLHEAARAANTTISIVEVLCADAWRLFEQGDTTAYLEQVAVCVRAAAFQGDVVVLAQASMANAALLCTDLPVPVLGSPRLGVEAAVQACHAALAGD